MPPNDSDDAHPERIDDTRLERIVEVYDAPERPAPAASPSRARWGGVLVAVCLGVAVLTGFAPVAVGLLLVALLSAVALTAADCPNRTADRVRSRAFGAVGLTDVRNGLRAVRATVEKRPR